VSAAEPRLYCYTRKGILANWSERMGGTFFLRWIIPVPYFGRQNNLEDVRYMELERDSCDELKRLEGLVDRVLPLFLSNQRMIAVPEH
jgi:hypothetical protein